MHHPHIQVQNDGTAMVDNNTIVIDFSGMPLRQLVAMRRLGIGMAAKTCSNWTEAATATVRAVHRYLDEAFKPTVGYDDELFTITIAVEQGDVESIYQAVIGFFQRENIRIGKPTGIRGLAS